MSSVGSTWNSGVVVEMLEPDTVLAAIETGIENDSTPATPFCMDGMAEIIIVAP